MIEEEGECMRLRYERDDASTKTRLVFDARRFPMSFIRQLWHRLKRPVSIMVPISFQATINYKRKDSFCGQRFGG